MAFGDCWRGANVTYFTEFRPLDGVSDIANAVLLLGVDEEPGVVRLRPMPDVRSERHNLPRGQLQGDG
jgi:Xaa-Pro aminopeptidase